MTIERNAQVVESVIAEHNRRFAARQADSLFVRRLRGIGVDRSTIAAVLVAMDDVCKHCWDERADRCTCMRDE